MKIKFNKFERVAGIFVLTAIVGTIAATFGIAAQKGWFSSKIKFEAILSGAEGIHNGTVVQIAGLRAGSVTEVDLLSANEVKVKFEVLEKFHSRIKEDSQLQVIRPFIIGEKVFDVSVGSEEAKVLPKNSIIATRESFDLMDVFSGRKMGPFLGTIEGLVENLKILADAFADEKRTRAMVKMFDRLEPLIKNLNEMSVGVVNLTDTVMKKKRLEIMLSNLTNISSELNVIIPQITEASPNIGKQIPALVENLELLTREFTKLTPAITAIAPELPSASKRALEALDETVITLKAIQKSFLLSGKVEEVKEEEKAKRKPASK